MKTEEKSGNKEKQALIIRKYKQFLKLEKGLSPNTLDAYQTDLFKLLHFLEGGETDVLNVTSDDLQRFIAGLHFSMLPCYHAKHVIIIWDSGRLVNPCRADPSAAAPDRELKARRGR